MTRRSMAEARKFFDGFCRIEPIWSSAFRRNHAIGGAPPSRRLPAWPARSGNPPRSFWFTIQPNPCRRSAAFHAAAGGTGPNGGFAPGFRLNFWCSGSTPSRVKRGTPTTQFRFRACLKTRCWVERATGLSAADCRRARAGSPGHPLFQQALSNSGSTGTGASTSCRAVSVRLGPRGHR